MTTTRTLPGSVREPLLSVAFEVGGKSWKLGMTSGFGTRPWVTSVVAGDWAAVRRVLVRAKARFGLSATAPVVSCYEAGRDGFWIHRALIGEGIGNRVVEIEDVSVVAGVSAVQHWGCRQVGIGDRIAIDVDRLAVFCE